MTIKDILVENYKKAIKALDNQANGDGIKESCGAGTDLDDMEFGHDATDLAKYNRDAEVYFLKQTIQNLTNRLDNLEKAYHTFVWDYQVEKKQAKSLRMDKKDGKRG